MYNSVVSLFNRYKQYLKPMEEKSRDRIREKYVQIYRGKLFRRRGGHKASKVVVFDLDETLGSFSEMESLWSGILSFTKMSTTIDGLLFDDFRQIMELYPEFLRTGILSILSFLWEKKNADDTVKLYIYTNNQRPSSWAYLISNYLYLKVGPVAGNCALFDQIVAAFKIGDQIVETRRTTNQKTYSDFIRCTMLPKNAEICFIDNTYFSKMENDRVYYIQPKTYYHGLNYQTIIERLLASNIFNEFTGTERFLEFMYNWFCNRRSTSFHRIKSVEEYEDDMVVSQKVMFHIKEFFLMNTNIPLTRKISSKIGRFTKKRHRK
jgi:hypothetical protein